MHLEEADVTDIDVDLRQGEKMVARHHYFFLSLQIKQQRAGHSWP